MIYKMTLTDSSDTMTFNLLETPIVDKDIEGAVDNVTLDGNQYTDYLYLKKQYIQKWAVMCTDEYDELRGFYTRQFEEGEIPSYRVYYGANVTKDYIYNGDYFQFNAKGIETGMSLSQLSGNAEQNGTPTPDAPVSISTVTGENKVKVFPDQKNLADPQTFIDWVNRTYALCVQYNWQTDATRPAYGEYQGRSHVVRFNADTLYSVRGSMTNPTYDEAKQIYVNNGQFKENTRYTVSFDMYGTGGTGNSNLRILYTDGTATLFGYTGTANAWGHKSVTTTSGKTIKTVELYYSSGFTYIDLDTLQIEEGTTATAYEPYQGQEYTIDLDTEELAKIGTYQDRIYKDEGKWYIEKQVGKVVFDGTQNWSGGTSTGSPSFLYAYNSTIDSLSKWNEPLGISDHFTIESAPLTTSSVKTAPCMSLSTASAVQSYHVRVFVPLTLASTPAEFKTWLSTHPTTVYYALATPTTTEITDDTLLAQLNFIANLYGGVNNISLVGTGAQGEMEVLIRDVLDVERDVVPETPVRLTLTDGGVINACGCRRDVQLTMRETTE